jgi:hypothetical protein
MVLPLAVSLLTDVTGFVCYRFTHIATSPLLPVISAFRSAMRDMGHRQLNTLGHEVLYNVECHNLIEQ